jgi:NAD(P)-dependent dehydrogenase (short-subunit alcohol dehydrogenase family)
MANVLITGCSTGIGYLAALRFARSGHRVYATMRNLAKAGPLREAAAAESLDVRVFELDVDSQASIDRAVAQVLADAGGVIDILVNNAGVTGLGAIETTTDEDLHATFETNFFGPLRLIRAVLPGMRERRSGAIVNVSSAAGRLSGPAYVAYHSSKWALECATETLGIEVRQFGVRVAAVEPGFFITPILTKATDLWAERELTPYADIERRMRDLYAAAGENGGDPEVVAAVIEEAATGPDRKLRWVVGADAENFIAGRDRLTDEEYQTLGDELTDEEWWARFFEFFPVPEPVAAG